MDKGDFILITNSVNQTEFPLRQITFTQNIQFITPRNSV